MGEVGFAGKWKGDLEVKIVIEFRDVVEKLISIIQNAKLYYIQALGCWMGIFQRFSSKKKADVAATAAEVDVETTSGFIRAKDVGPKPSNHVEEADYHVVYDGGDGSYSIAIGNWKSDSRIANTSEKMRTIFFRWNGPTDEKIGFPNNNGKGGWFPLPPEFASLILDHIADKNFDYWYSLLELEG